MLEHETNFNDALILRTVKSICTNIPAGVIAPANCECGNPIQLERRKMGYDICVECKTAEEKYLRHFAHNKPPRSVEAQDVVA